MLRGLTNLKISQKIPLLVIGSVLVLGLALGLAGVLQAQSLAHQSNQDKLSGVLSAKKQAISDYLEGVSADVHSLVTNKTVTLAISRFARAYGKLKDNATTELQRLYIDENPNPDHRELYKGGDDKSDYTNKHIRNHAWFSDHTLAQGFDDLYLIDDEGNVVYSVFKRPDFAENIMTGQFKDSGLGEAFRAAAKLEEGQQVFIDYEPYAPRGGEPAAFLAEPIFTNGRYKGVLAIQLPVSRLDSVMQNVVGLGETGETYLAGTDGLWRSNSRLSDEPSFMKFKVIPAVTEAIKAGESGSDTFTNPVGVQVLAAFAPLDFLGHRWTVVASQAEEEIGAPVREMQLVMLIITVALLAIIVIVAILVSKGITRPLTAMTGAMEELAEGGLDVEIHDQNRQDEIGAMAKALMIFKENAAERRRLRAEQEAEAAEREKRAKALDDLVSSFTLAMQQAVEAVGQAATSMTETAETLSETAQDADRQAREAANASTSASENVQTAAAAAEELSASIHEINQNVSQSTSMSSRASNQARDTNKQVAGLVETAERIGEVVNLISDIAEQTNLLALNATIEAARAGDAGKGFAVVATEVKSLASQTAKATEEISQQVSGIQSATDMSAKSIREISDMISELDSIATSIASAVEEQGAATQEIARNAQHASGGTSAVSQNVTAVSEAVAQTNDAASSVLESANALAQQAQVMQQELQDFAAKIRSI
ncbi:methyl-accepting chemotaxis protein [Aestuariispira ectoiniformans]|uniref:methyl-accepting chemotaxis protein n=1 Tax=Aestuariispira ectoiniformans TaxID=2775080 RepID=UPI00223BE465|nr:methyl-accepting chemotaxis protein [Aestuariispira ectoiniformans]